MTAVASDIMEFHLQQLLKHCRICGKRLSKAKCRTSVFDCSNFRDNLLMTFGVDVNLDDIQVCPLKFCKPCHAVMSRAVKAANEGTPYTHTVTPMIWSTHTDNCQVIINNFNNNKNNNNVTNIYILDLCPL